MTKRRIAILASWYPQPEAPVNGSFVQDQARLLSRLYDVAVIAPRAVRWRDLLSPGWGPKQTVTNESGLLVIRTRWAAPFPRYPSHRTYRASYRAIRLSFDELLKRWGRPDIMHAHVALPGGWAAVQLGREYGFPVVLTEHASGIGTHRFTTKLGASLVETAYRGAQRVLAVSPSLRSQILQYVPGVPITIAPNVIPTEFFVPGVDVGLPGRDRPWRFLMVAILTEDKGGRHLIEAAQRLKQGGCERFCVVIGGDGPPRGDWEAMVRAAGLAEHFEFLGALDAEQVRRQMQQCDVFVLPSLHETFGVVLGEAMACGKPVLTTRCGGPEYVVTPETGVLVPPGDTQSLADAMQGFIDGRHRFDADVVRRTVIERFGEQAFLDQLSEIYDSLRGSP